MIHATLNKAGGGVTRSRPIPEHIEPPGASEKLRSMLNGSSSGSTMPWDYNPDDYLLATVTQRETYLARYGRAETVRLYLLIEEGTEGGRPMEHHCHRILLCNHVELRNMTAKFDPKEGDLLALWYGGRDDTRETARHLFRYSVERAHGADEF